MRTQEEIQKDIEANELRRKELENELAGLPWAPKNGEEYHRVSLYEGEAIPGYGEMGRCGSLGDLKNGNVYRTQEEAEQRARVINFTKPKCPRPEIGQEVWIVTVTHEAELSIGRVVYGQRLTIPWHLGWLSDTKEGAEAIALEAKELFK